MVIYLKPSRQTSFPLEFGIAADVAQGYQAGFGDIHHLELARASRAIRSWLHHHCRRKPLTLAAIFRR